MLEEKPYLWIIDSPREPLASCLDAFTSWSDILYIAPGQPLPDWNEEPDAVFFSTELPGGPEGELFTGIVENAGNIPLMAVTSLRSLAQAVAFFRAGASDYLSLPLDENDALERLTATLEQAKRKIMSAVMVELEAVDDPGQISLSLSASNAGPAVEEDPDEDILAELPPPFVPYPSPDEFQPRPQPDPLPAEDEPVAVDGLPISTLWEELPCGLLVFDAEGEIVFSNSLGLEVFGHADLAELREALERRRSSFNAYSANHKPLPDNQWPQALAMKTRTARSAVLSVERPDKRRHWLRIDCLPHLAEGRMSRLTMTIVNLTGELPPLVVSDQTTAPRAKPDKGKQRGGKKKR